MCRIIYIVRPEQSVLDGVMDIDTLIAKLKTNLDNPVEFEDLILEYVDELEERTNPCGDDIEECEWELIKFEEKPGTEKYHHGLVIMYCKKHGRVVKTTPIEK